MKRILAVVLILSGVCAIGFGGYRALTAFIGIYQSNLADPLGQPQDSEKAASQRMLQGAMIGGTGALLSMTGYVLWRLRPRSALWQT